LVWKSTARFSLGQGFSTFKLNSQPVITNCTIVVALEIMKVREAMLMRSRKIMKKIKLRRFRSKQRTNTLLTK
jgi:hypothetical protein